MVMRSDYQRVVCHDVVRLVIYYLHGREVGLPTGGMPRCREFGYLLFPRSWSRVYRRVVCHNVVRSGLLDGLRWVYGTVHCLSLIKV